MSDRRTALVTGAARGIGRAIAEDLASAGVEIALADVDLESARSTAGDITASGGKAFAVEVQVSDPESVTGMFERISGEWGRLDFLINNAGMTRDALLMRMDDEAWRSVIDVNLTGTYLCTRAVIRLMLKQKSGRIVNVSSVVGAMGNAGQTNYAASKAGIIGFTKSLAREVAARGITVNAVAPGFISTSMTDALPQKAREDLVGLIPSGRLGLPEDVAAAVRYLVSDGASYVTGQVLHVNGGMYM